MCLNGQCVLVELQQRDNTMREFYAAKTVTSEDTDLIFQTVEALCYTIVNMYIFAQIEDCRFCPPLLKLESSRKGSRSLKHA